MKINKKNSQKYSQASSSQTRIVVWEELKESQALYEREINKASCP